MQRAFLKFRDELKEHVVTPNKEVTLTINGKLEVIDLQIDTTVQKDKIERLLIESINIAIKSVSLKIQNKLTPIHNAMNK